MKKKILIGSIIAVALLTLVSFSSVVGYNSVKSDLDISVEENKEIVYQEKSSEEDCGCEDDNSENGRWRPIICAMLYPIWLVASAMAMWGGFFTFYIIMVDIGREFNCYFAGGPDK